MAAFRAVLALMVCGWVGSLGCGASSQSGGADGGAGRVGDAGTLLLPVAGEGGARASGGPDAPGSGDPAVPAVESVRLPPNASGDVALDVTVTGGRGGALQLDV